MAVCRPSATTDSPAVAVELVRVVSAQTPAGEGPAYVQWNVELLINRPRKPAAVRQSHSAR